MIGSLFAWWIGQLAEILPARLRRASYGVGDALLIEPSFGGQGQIAVALRVNGRATPVGEFALNSAELARLPQSPSRPIVLQLAEANVLQKLLNLPLAARAELDQVLAFEMDQETPFGVDEVYWGYRIEAVDAQRGRISVSLILVPKTTLSSLLDALAQAGVVPRSAEVVDTTGRCTYLPLTDKRGRPWQRPRRLVAPVAACCGLLAVAAIVIPFLRQAAELAALGSQIAADRASANQAEALRGEIDRLSRGAELIDNEFGKSGRPLDVVAAVTSALPDDTYLTELELRQRKLTIGGRSAGAARLISAMVADQRFRNPTFAAPVTRLPALHADVFSITATMDGAP